MTNNYRIVLRRGTHRNEAVAFYLAPQVCQYLQQLGYSCVLETKPLLATAYGKMLKGREKRSNFRFKGDLYISFHDQPAGVSGLYFRDHERTCNGKRNVVVEIPAIYREITNPTILERVEKWIDRNKQRRYLAEDRGYMRQVSDVKASIVAGLAGEDVVKEIAERILKGA